MPNLVMLPPTVRFSSRVADYVKYRPGYPLELLKGLTDLIGFNPTWTVGDIGSGTGKLTELFLDHGNVVFAVEPNLEMRQAAESMLSGYPNFHSVDATAEQTRLVAESVDLVVAGQAFHWFEPIATKAEFARILKPGGWIALIWNDRRVSGTPFLEAYEGLLRAFPEYGAVGHKAVEAMKLEGFFDEDHTMWSVPSRQEFDWDGLRGRALSSSYVPGIGQPGNEEFVADLERIFLKYSENGRVSFDYETQMFVGRVGR